MTAISHLLVLSQPAFLDRQVEAAMAEPPRGLGRRIFDLVGATRRFF
jgi:hypothetical protein